MKYVIKNMKFEIWLPHSLSCEANFIWYKNLIWGLANVNIKSIANNNQANLANITWSSICVNLQTYIQIQSEFQGYDQLTSVHTMSTLVQIFFCIEGWDKAIMHRRTINEMPERRVEKYSEGGACIPLLLPMIFNIEVQVLPGHFLLRVIVGHFQVI